MNIRPFPPHKPQYPSNCFVDDSAILIGQVSLGQGCSIWPLVVIRGDVNRITIGDYCNIQDGSIIHVNHQSPLRPAGDPTTLEHHVTVGHRVTLHGCRIGHHCLIGMDSQVLDAVDMPPFCLIGAGSLVTARSPLRSHMLHVGRPAKPVRPLTPEEIEHLSYSATFYYHLGQRHKMHQAQ